MNLSSKEAIQVQHNRRVHDAGASSYEKIHVEIYNQTEQTRISRVLKDAVSSIDTSAERPRVLDFGAGTGNLTGHLLELGADVVAADVSQRSLDILRQRYSANDRLEFLALNGVDISGLEDNSVDMVVTYSVLHHVPDYLGAVREFLRVVKPGGIIYIDHEAAPRIWDCPSNNYRNYINELQRIYSPAVGIRIARKIKNLFSFRAWKRLVNRKLFGLNEEGDIHVTLEDHIEWSSIADILLSRCQLLAETDYLVCREIAKNPVIHAQYQAHLADMRMLICRKVR